MWGGFPKVIKEVFPKASIVIDRFHVRNIYESKLTVKGGLSAIKKWLIYAKILLKTAGETLENHLPEIANYFISRTTSGVPEGINTKIKLILRQSYGFKNFNLMRQKLLACLLK
jgi:transposase